MANSASEANIQDAILEYLTRKGYTCWRQNSVGVWDGRGFYRKPPKYSVNGISDIIVLSSGKAYFIEVKSAKGKVSDDQVLFKEFVERAGCEYMIARSIDDIIDAGF